jgi:subtilase family serine protease
VFTLVKEVLEMTDKVTAQVILRSASGSSILESKEAITAENIAKYRAGNEAIEEVSQKLNRLGFQVVQVGPTSLTISGDKSRFEEVFQTTLQARKREVLGSKIPGAETSYYEATAPVKVPPELSSQVVDVVLPTPPEFFP